MTSDLRARTVLVDDAGRSIEFCYDKGGPTACRSCRPRPTRWQRTIARPVGDGDEVVCEYPERNRLVTVEHVAMNAVMAGCKPEYVP